GEVGGDVGEGAVGPVLEHVQEGLGQRARRAGQIELAVVVVVAPNRDLAFAVRDQGRVGGRAARTGGRGDVGEGAVTVVAKQVAGRLARHVEIDIAVVVVVPSRDRVAVDAAQRNARLRGDNPKLAVPDVLPD